MPERLARPRRLGVTGLAVVALTSAVSVVGMASLAGAAYAGPGFTPAVPGTVFISDVWQDQVLAVAPDGTKSVYVSGVQPFGLSLDDAGDLFIAQDSNDVVKIAADGTRTDVVFGTVSYGYQLAADPAGNIFLADPNNNRVVEMTTDGVEQTVPIDGLNGVSGVAADAEGNLLVADGSNGRVVKVTPGGVQSDVATSLSYPTAVAAGPDGSVVVADSYNRILQIAADGTQTDVGFQNVYYARSLAVDATGTVIASSQDDFMFNSGSVIWQKGVDGPETALTSSNSGYVYGIAVSQNRAPQAVSFTSDPGATPTVGDRYDVTATGGDSGKPVTFSAGPDSADVCTVVSHLDSSATVRLTGRGTCTIDAAQSDTRGYLAGAQQQSFQVLAAGALAFTSEPSTPRVGDTYRATAGSDSPEAVAFESSSPNSCSVSTDGVVTFLHAGDCTVHASQPGNGDYLAGSATQVIHTRRAIQTVAFTSQAPHRAHAGTTYKAKATGNTESGRKVRITGLGACSVGRHGLVSFNHRGTCTVFAIQTGNPDYQPGKAKQVIVVTPARNRSAAAVEGTTLVG
ncbi:NHL repeat-containing protein [Nocardioides cynanchi]|uniref:NHL repeat-containing protein n=1 Tax=Nocardioides cynanchi TaxID=2558918 RepID=UPI00124927BB|nr:NHL repeat-containing protein [Nocardioides cynanchi]